MSILRIRGTATYLAQHQRASQEMMARLTNFISVSRNLDVIDTNQSSTSKPTNYKLTIPLSQGSIKKANYNQNQN